jgi:MOB kinase activator 1
MGGLFSWFSRKGAAEKVDKKTVETALAAEENVAEAYTYWKTKKAITLKQNAPASAKRGVLQTKMLSSFLGPSQPEKNVKLPEGEDLNEWIAVHTVQFFEALQMIYGTTAEYCTAESCPSMTAGKAEYLWKDGGKYKKATRVPAATYIDELFNWVSSEVSDTKLFPVEDGEFPRNFVTRVKNIFKRLFRVYAHIYYHHFEEIRKVGANAHLNSCFKHFVYFTLEYDMIEKKDMAPLQDLIDRMQQHDKAAVPSAAGGGGAPVSILSAGPAAASPAAAAASPSSEDPE